MKKIKVITLCGSVKFKEEFTRQFNRLTLLGNVILTPAFDLPLKQIGEGEKKLLKLLHFKRIEMADEILVINKGGYIGESTMLEIEHAKKLGKKISYLESI